MGLGVATRLRQRLNAVVLAGLLGAVVVLSGFHAGISVSQLELHDGGVWVTNAALRLAAHLNYPSRTLDGGLTAPGAGFDVSQSGTDVVLLDTGRVTAQVIDTAALKLSSPTSLGGFAVSQGKGTYAVSDAATGRVWGVPVAELPTFTPDAVPALSDLPGARALATAEGAILAWDKEGHVRRLERSGTAWRAVEAGSLPAGAIAKDTDFTTVGGDLVAFTPSTGSLATTRLQTRIDAPEGAVLQAVGPGADDVLIATPTALIRVPLGGGNSTRVEAGSSAKGTPARPVRVGDCAYAAWGGTGRYVRDCPNDGDDQALDVPSVKTSKALVFRVNHDVVVLNDTTNGDTYLSSNMSVPVNNWKDITRQLKQRDERQDSSSKTLDVTKPPERGAQNRPPVAVPDEFGARAGGTTVLPVLDNDSDPDGDVLTATPATQPATGSVSATAGGEAVQITLPSTASGSTTFDYVADDGREGTAKGTVTVGVHPSEVNDPPTQRRTIAVTVEAGKEVALNALQGWVDPDGDPMLLKSATAPDGMAVRYRADGTLWVRDLGSLAPGRREVKLIVADGRAEAGGVVTVDVLKAGNTAPVANPDRATVFVGRATTVRPLLNDTDANGDVLHLTAVAPTPAGLSVTPDTQAGTVAITATKAGESYVAYTATDGPATSESFIRVTALDPKPGATPVAGADTVLLPAGGSATVDVLANDVDPAGGVLLIRSVALPTATTLLVQVVDHGVLRVEAPGGLTAPAAFDYTVTNGTATATGRVTVVPTAAATPGAPPVTAPDQALVRAGDIVTIPVLANDSSPVGLRLSVAPDVPVGDPALGQAFASDGVVRFRAAGQAGTTTLTYTAVDSLGQVASGVATVTIRGTGDGNAAPTPKPLTARLLAGMTTRIHVPMAGVDPDGDSVSLAGLASAPTKGTAKVTGDVIEYTAPATAAGTDVFSYALQDAAGGRGVATVQVGIAPVATTNAPPVARPDQVVARPARALAIPVLANDSDPDGDLLSLVPDSIQPASAATGTVARADGSRVLLETPQATGVLAYYYEVDDGHGGRTRGSVTVDVRPDAPLVPPSAADDVVAAADVAGRDALEVDVLKNDDDPDGDVRRLVVRSDDPGVRVSGDRLVVPVGDRRRVFLYTVTDPDGLTARAAVFVPAKAGQPPRLREDRFPLRVKAGGTVTLPLADYVIVRDGRSPRLASEAGVSAAAGSNGAPLAKDATTLTYTSAPTFRGLTSLNAEITDGADAKDTGALTALLSLPIVVEGPGGTPPTVRPSEIVLTPGQPAKRVDLGPTITDPDPGDAAKATVTLGAVTAGFTVTLEGRTLVASAGADAKDGQAGTAEITVSDGSSEPVKATVPLRVLVVPENRPPMVVTPAVIGDVRPGETRDVDITKYVTNPYADQGKPLTLVGTPAVAAGSGTASATGTTVRVAAAGEARGDVVATYVVADASGKPDRQAQGTIRLQLRVPPDPPTGVRARSGSAKSATVAWTSGPANGSPITRFTVSWAGGSKDCGAATSCAITGLSAGTEYTFTVVATSAYGDSKPSAPSNTIKLANAKPTVPGVPTGKAGDKKVDLTWAPASVEGGGPVSYVVQISPGGTQRQATGTSLTWDGLTNGTAYTFIVQARAATETSAWSGSSTAATPLGLPGAPQAPTTNVRTGMRAFSVDVQWRAPDSGGDSAPLTYEVRRSDGAAPAVCRDTTATSCVDSSFLRERPTVTYAVRARNRSGWGPWSPDSAPVKEIVDPGPVTGVTATPTGQNNQVTIRFTAPANAPTGVSYGWSAAGKTGALPAGGGTVTDAVFVNGTNVPVAVTASVPGGNRTTSAAVPVNAYGPPKQVVVTSQTVGVHRVEFRWNAAGATNGRPLSHVEIGSFSSSPNIVGDGRRNPISGQGILNTNFGTTYRFRAVDQLGNSGPWTEATSLPAVVPPGTPTPTFSMAAFVPAGGYPKGCTPGCMSTYGYGVTLRNYRPSSQVQCSVAHGKNYGPPNARLTRVFAVDGTGSKGPAKADFSGSTGEALSDLRCAQLS